MAPLTLSDVEDWPSVRSPFPVPVRRFQPHPLSVCLEGCPPWLLAPGFWLLAFLPLHLVIWVRAVQHRESLVSGDLVVRCSCLFKPAGAKRRSWLLGCRDVLWTLKAAGSIAGLEPGIGKSGTRLCAVSAWGCWVSSNLPPQTSFWPQRAHGRKRPPQPSSENSSVWMNSSPASVNKLLCALITNYLERSRLPTAGPCSEEAGLGWGGRWWELAGYQKGIGTGQSPSYVSYLLAF